MSGLSAVVITRNEERNIERCLKSLSFCDEIIVVDSGSTDRTGEIAKQFTKNVVSRAWTGYADQKNYGVSLATGEWVLSVDADEEITDELRSEITQLQRNPNGASAYSIPRRTLYSGRWIRHGGWYPNRLVRLFKRDDGKWIGEEIHERWESKGDTKALSGHIQHYSFDSISDQVARNNHYSTLGAKALHKSGVAFSWFSLVVKPQIKFVETYFIKLGMLDGFPGFVISVSAAYSVFLKWAKLRELEKDAKK